MQRHVGEYLSPRLGGSLQAWGNANQVIATREFKRYKDHSWGTGELDFLAFQEQSDRDWLVGMTEMVGVEAPEGDACLRLAREAYGFVARRVRAAFPGAVDVIRQLHTTGYPLYTASGEDSDHLDGYL